MVGIKKHILILAPELTQFRSAVNYLTNREWNVKISTDLKEFLDYLNQAKPDYVLVCMDFPSANIKVIPKTISERVRACVIASAYKSNLDTHRKVNEAGMEFKILPPLTGPSIEKISEKYTYKIRSFLERQKLEEQKRIRAEEKILRHAKASQEGSSLDYKNMGLTNRGLSQELKIQTIKPTIVESEEKKAREIVLKATDQIISEFVDNKSNESGRTHLEIVPTQIGCMQVETNNFSGYLVAAMGDDFPLGEKFNRIVHKRLNEFLISNGETINPDLECFNIQVKPVAFLDWAKDYAEFLRKAVHRGNQIAFAFFPFKGIRASYSTSAAPDMLSIPLSEFLGGNQVNFDVYLYLSTNRKYVLYTPKNAIFYEEQQKRLAQKGVTHLHIKRTDLRELNKYKAQRYFNSIINEFSSSQMMADSVA